jgi:hypothetical protein
MDCSEVEPLLDAYVDGELELTSQLDLEAHVATRPGMQNCSRRSVGFSKFASHEYPDLLAVSQGYNLCGWNQSGLNYLIVSAFPMELDRPT